ncbi:MAG: FtsX-like permease family protein [Planctomycetes bacterium]|nr:FtsX-like permease family protein [Planctomycetota bacterium]
MVRTALEMLLGDRLKYVGLVVGLAFAALLITQQASIFSGFMLRTGAWIRDTGQADLWIMDRETEFTDDRKPMLDSALLRVRGIDGIDWAVPLFKGYVALRLPDGRRRNVRMLGIDDATLAGAPPEMVEGELADLRRDRGLFVDVADAADDLALRSVVDGEGPRPLRVGDHLDVNDHAMTVVGLSRRSREFFWDPLIVTTYQRALQVAPHERRLMAMIIAKVAPGEDPKLVAQRVERSTDLAAYTPDEFESVSTDFVMRKTGILENFGITIALGFVIGVLVAGQMLYNFILENQRAFAAMKAMGASNARITKMVSVQVLFAATLGFGIGVGLAALSGKVLERTGLAFHMNWQIPVYGALGLFACAWIAALFSIQRVLRLDPATVFKG